MNKTVFQVGVGSGGIVVLGALVSDPRIQHVSLIDPDIYQEHNVERHRFDRGGIGQLKVDLAKSSLNVRFPNLTLNAKPWDLCDPAQQSEIESMVEQCDVGVCAADNESAKYHFDALMRRFKKPWTLGEVLSGGIGGFVHRFFPGGPCYGCVASFLQRNVTEGPAGKAPDYSAPGGPVEETRIPASKAAIETIAGLHALITLDLLDDSGADVGFTSLLFSMKKVDGVFAEAFRAHRFQVPRLESCLICGTGSATTPENLDVALDQAFTRDWAVPELGPATPHEAVRIRSELAGLVLDNQPIPWNADAVTVEVGLRLPTTARRKDDFILHISNRTAIAAESLRVETPGGLSIVSFRFAPPAHSALLELHWRDRVLGRAELRILERDVFLKSLKMQLPTLHARLGEDMVACQTFVSSQCSGITVAGLLSAATSLAPLLEIGVLVEIRGSDNELLAEVPVPLSGGQLLHQQALITAFPRKFVKRSGNWKVVWKVGSRELAAVHAKAIAPAKFRRSLKVVGTRWIVETDGGMTMQTVYPKSDNAVRVGPCFLVSSLEPGMAARTTFEIATHGSTNRQPVVQESLVTDGPALVTPGTVPIEQLAGIQGFELLHHGKSLGTLPMNPVPAAQFDSEGGFQPALDFAWGAAAEEELGERLKKLMGK